MSDTNTGILLDIVARLARIESKIGNGTSGGGSSSTRGEVASDADLDGQYGDPEVRRDPKQWLTKGGESFAGRRMSECPAEYLDSLAGFLEWRATREEQEPEKAKYAAYSRRDAARARGWAARNRGKGAPVAKTKAAVSADFDAAGFDDDESIPF